MEISPYIRDIFFALNMRNNTSFGQEVVLFDTTGKYNSTNGLTPSTQYRWDLTDELVTADINRYNILFVLAKSNTYGSTYSIYTAANPSGTISNIGQVVSLLNGLGIGKFVNIGGNTVQCYSDIFLFSSINLAGNFLSAQATNIRDYNMSGTIIYDEGYSTNLIGELSQINVDNFFWINNGSAPYACPYNRTAITSFSIPLGANYFLSMFANITSSTSKIVHIGFNTQGISQIYLNNIKIIEILGSDYPAIVNNINTITRSAYSNTNLYQFFFIIPIQLDAGDNLIQVNGAVVNSGAIKFGFGLEVYDNTSTQIAAATSYSGLNLLYNTVNNYIPQNLF